MKLIVTCGGAGGKLWPMARKSKPKQFLTIIGDKSLFRYNLELLLTRYKPEDIFLSTKKKFKQYIDEQAPEIPSENLLFEPDYFKDTGPAMLYALTKVAQRFPEESFVQIQSDVMREPTEVYLDMIDGFNEIVMKYGKFITGGLTPKFPDMGVDYLKVGKRIELDSDLEAYESVEFVRRFYDFDKTKALIDENENIMVHTNHYAWTTGKFLEMIKKLRPDWYAAGEEMKKYFGTPDEEKEIDRIYSNMEAGMIEELSIHVFNGEGIVVKVPYEWKDVGTWSSVYNISHKDENGNILKGKALSFNSTGNIVYQNGSKPVLLVGTKNLVVIEDDDCIMVCDMNEAGNVKKAVETLGLTDLM